MISSVSSMVLLLSVSSDSNSTLGIVTGLELYRGYTGATPGLRVPVVVTITVPITGKPGAGIGIGTATAKGTATSKGLGMHKHRHMYKLSDYLHLCRNPSAGVNCLTGV